MLEKQEASVKALWQEHVCCDLGAFRGQMGVSGRLSGLMKRGLPCHTNGDWKSLDRFNRKGVMIPLALMDRCVLGQDLWTRTEPFLTALKDYSIIPGKTEWQLVPC